MHPRFNKSNEIRPVRVMILDQISESEIEKHRHRQRHRDRDRETEERDIYNILCGSGEK